MKITKQDIGRQVVDGYGDVDTIIAFIEGEEYPVVTSGDNSEASYTEDGVYLLYRPNSWANLVRFLDED